MHNHTYRLVVLAQTRLENITLLHLELCWDSFFPLTGYPGKFKSTNKQLEVLVTCHPAREILKSLGAKCTQLPICSLCSSHYWETAQGPNSYHGAIIWKHITAHFLARIDKNSKVMERKLRNWTEPWLTSFEHTLKPMTTKMLLARLKVKTSYPTQPYSGK